MDIMKIGAELLANKMGSGIQQNLIQSALGNLMGGGSAGGLAGLVGKLQGGDLGDVVGSWLGKGENKEISEQQVEGIFGADKIKETAESLGTDSSSLLSGLKNALPQMVDKSSPDGSLLDSVGGISGAMDMAKGFLGK